jgi:hypothetical protein
LRSVFFFLVCCSSLSQLADLRKEALAGWRLAAGLGRRWRSERERRWEVALVLARSDALASWRLVQEEGAVG